MVLLRHLLGDALRRLRLRQGRTLREVSDNFALAELQSEPVLSGTREPSLRPAEDPMVATPVVHPFGGAVPAALNLATAPELGDAAKLGDGAKLGEGGEPVIGTIKLPSGHQAGYDDVARRIRDITDMVPV